MENHPKGKYVIIVRGCIKHLLMVYYMEIQKNNTKDLKDILDLLLK